MTTDRLGTTVARVNGRGEHPLMVVVGHIDEIALLVSHVSDKGYLHVVQSGGWDAQVLVGQRVEILTRDGMVPGVVGRKPPHLTDAEERKKAVEVKNLHVDIGAKDGDEARSMVAPGDQALIAAEPLDMPNGRVASRALDNRLGVYVAIEVARRVKEAGGGAGPVAGVAAVQEEIGAHGARVMAYGLEPDLAVVVDVTHATDAPGVDPGELGDHGLGSGPVITRGAIVNRAVNDLLDEVASAEGIECTTEASGRAHRHRRRHRPPQPHRRGRPRSSRSRCATCTRRWSWWTSPTSRRPSSCSPRSPSGSSRTRASRAGS